MRPRLGTSLLAASEKPSDQAARGAEPQTARSGTDGRARPDDADGQETLTRVARLLTAPLPHTRVGHAVRGFVMTVASVVIVGTAWHHEPWFDETQAWLIARDATPTELLRDVCRYEGHPPLWHAILMPLAQAGLPVEAMQVVSALLALAGIAYFLIRSPLPAVLTILMPLTFWMAYQYAVVARCYALYPLLIFALADTAPRRLDHPGRWAMLLILTGLVTVHGTILAAALGAETLAEVWQCRRNLGREARRRLAAWALVTFAWFGTTALILWPPADNAVAVAGLTDPGGVQPIRVSAVALVVEAFTGGFAFGLVMWVALTAWAFVRWQRPQTETGSGILPRAGSEVRPISRPSVAADGSPSPSVAGFGWLVGLAGIIGLMQTVYCSGWHVGIVVLILLGWLWTTWPRGARPLRRRALAVAAALTVLWAIAGLTQIRWTVHDAMADVTGRYAAPRDGAAYLQTSPWGRCDVRATTPLAVGLLAWEPDESKRTITNYNVGRPYRYRRHDRQPAFTDPAGGEVLLVATGGEPSPPEVSPEPPSSIRLGRDFAYRTLDLTDYVRVASFPATPAFGGGPLMFDAFGLDVYVRRDVHRQLASEPASEPTGSTTPTEPAQTPQRP